MTALVKYDLMCRSIDEALAIDEVKPVRDLAMAAALYARQAKNRDAERRAMEIRVRAERKAGELLSRMEKATASTKPTKGVKGVQRRSHDETSARPKTLAQLGVSKQQSSDWQRLAAFPEEDFEAALATAELPSGRAIIEHPKEPILDPVMEEGRRLGEELRGFSPFEKAIDWRIAQMAGYLRLWNDANKETKLVAQEGLIKDGFVKSRGELLRKVRSWSNQVSNSSAYRATVLNKWRALFLGEIDGDVLSDDPV
jgi:hypothetical protein